MPKPNMNPELSAMARDVSTLRADPRNARTHDEANLTAIEVSFREHGQQYPIVVDSTGKVLAGNGRLEVAHRLGWDKIAAIEFSGEHASAFALADNRTGELGAWNNDILAELLSEIPPDLIDLTGFTLKAAELILPPTEQHVQDLAGEWDGMPEFESDDKMPHRQITVNLHSDEGVADFAQRLDVEVTDKTRSVHFPPQEIDSVADVRVVSE